MDAPTFEKPLKYGKKVSCAKKTLSSHLRFVERDVQSQMISSCPMKIQRYDWMKEETE